MTDQPLDDLIARLERERLEADRLYHDALTALDGVVQSAPNLPEAAAPADVTRLSQVNRGWDILPHGAPPIDRSLKGRLRGFIWRLVGPPLDAQRSFNAAIIDHINRNWSSQRGTTEAVAGLIETLRRELDRWANFEWRLLEYLRTITAYIDSKDRSLAAADLRERMALAEQRILALKRAVEARADSKATVQLSGQAEAVFSGRLDSPAYVGFEDRFRGSQEDIRGRAEEYMPLLASASDVLDVGCGRGEFLELLRARGVAARGVDANHAMVEQCRSRGLDAHNDDALAYLERQEDGSVGALVAIQVVEHFDPAYLMRFLEAAFHKMRVDAPLVLETINAACWTAFFDAYLRDPTHQRALHPDTLKYLVEASGFRGVDVRFRRPVLDKDRLPRVQVPSGGSAVGGVAELAIALNAQADALNARLFSFTDYAVIARR